MRITTTRRGIWRLSFPIIIAGASEIVIDLTDAMFLSRFGIVELGAVGLADAIYAVAIVLTLGLVDGIQIVVSRRAGQNDDRGIGRAFNQGVMLLAIASVVLTLGIRFVAPLFTEGIFASSEITTAVNKFLGIIAFAVFFHAVNLAYSALYVGISRTRALIGATVVLALTNIALDYCLIFGNFGFERMGIAGAAIASLAAEIAAFAYLTVYTLIRLDIRKYGLFAFGRWDAQLSRLLVRLSAPVALETLVEAARWFVVFAFIEQLGELALAQFEIIYLCYIVFLIPVEGLSEATCSMVSNLIGQDKSNLIGRLLRNCITLGYLTTLPLVGAALFLPEVLVTFFRGDEPTVSACAAALRVVGVALVIIVPGEMFVSAVAGTGDTRMCLVFELAGTVCILLYTYAAAFHFGQSPAYVWGFLIVGWLVWLMSSASWLHSGRWKRLRI